MPGRRVPRMPGRRVPRMPGRRVPRTPGRRAPGLGGGLQMFSIGNFFDDLLAEYCEVVRLAAGDEVSVQNNLFIDPVSTGVLEVGLERGPGGDFLAAHDSGFDQCPWSVADGRDRLAGIGEFSHEVHRLEVGSQVIRIDDAAGKNQRVVIRCPGLIDRLVYFEGVAPFLELPAFGLATFESYQGGWR